MIIILCEGSVFCSLWFTSALGMRLILCVYVQCWGSNPGPQCLLGKLSTQELQPQPLADIFKVTAELGKGKGTEVSSNEMKTTTFTKIQLVLLDYFISCCRLSVSF